MNGGCKRSGGGCGRLNGGCRRLNGGGRILNGGCGGLNGGCGGLNGGCGGLNGGRGGLNGGLWRIKLRPWGIERRLWRIERRLWRIEWRPWPQANSHLKYSSRRGTLGQTHKTLFCSTFWHGLDGLAPVELDPCEYLRLLSPIGIDLRVCPIRKSIPMGKRPVHRPTKKTRRCS